MNLETIKTDRLILRKFSPSDFIYLFENYSDEEIKQTLGHSSHEEFLIERSKYEKGYTNFNRSFEHFQVVDQTSMNSIGSCKFHNRDVAHRRAELGYSITNESFKGLGIMSETLKIVIDYGFNEMNLHRIEAFVGTRNIPSLKLMAKFNFVKEGLLREHYFINQKFEDSLVISKLLSEYTSEV